MHLHPQIQIPNAFPDYLEAYVNILNDYLDSFETEAVQDLPICRYVLLKFLYSEKATKFEEIFQIC